MPGTPLTGPDMSGNMNYPSKVLQGASLVYTISHPAQGLPKTLAQV